MCRTFEMTHVYPSELWRRVLWPSHLQKRKTAVLEEVQDNNDDGIHFITSFMLIRMCSCED